MINRRDANCCKDIIGRARRYYRQRIVGPNPGASLILFVKSILNDMSVRSSTVLSSFVYLNFKGAD